ncbi:MAG TPA: putative DNA-binding domain-containing protein [Tepidisphaeraceae bacterium]|nr:putative DNA-binding domain-containing protein [Tepidisphaeraceae bacterium]
MRSSPDSPPRKRQTLTELRELQRRTASVIFRPLTPEFQTQRKWTDGRDSADVIAEFIKPNDRLTSFERLEIYNRQYWYRLIDNVYEDFPGLLAILGQKKFSPLTRAYLAKYPSRSYTLRNLGRNMPKFIEDEPKWTHPYETMALDMARFEWAQVVAFDGPAETPINIDDLLGKNPDHLRLGLQPYITVLEMAYPLDTFSLAIKKAGFRTEASNAMDERGHEHRVRKIRRPRRKRTFVAVHRHNYDLYYYRLEPAAYRLLCALRDGKTLTQACQHAGGEATPRLLKKWFANWAGLGWFCKPG